MKEEAKQARILELENLIRLLGFQIADAQQELARLRAR